MSTQSAVVVENSDAMIGERIHALLWRSRLSQATFAKTLGVSQSTMSKKLRGERPWYTGELIATSQALDVTIAYLYGETKEAPTPKGGGHTLPDLDSNQEPAG